MKLDYIDSEELLPFCECGQCGLRVTKKGNRFINGHNRRGEKPYNYGKSPSEAQLKKQSDSHKGKKMLPQTRAALLKALTGRVVSEETREKNRRSNVGLKRSPETRRNNSIAMKKLYKERPEIIDQISETVQTFYDNMDDPGQQIVGHHMIYDHSDLSKNIMKMTRSMHARLHALFRKHGIVIPHINVEE